MSMLHFACFLLLLLLLFQPANQPQEYESSASKSLIKDEPHPIPQLVVGVKVQVFEHLHIAPGLLVEILFPNFLFHIFNPSVLNTFLAKKNRKKGPSSKSKLDYSTPYERTPNKISFYF